MIYNISVTDSQGYLNVIVRKGEEMNKWTVKTGNDRRGNITIEDRATGQRLGTFDSDDGYFCVERGVNLSEERIHEIEEYQKVVGLTDW